MPLNIKQTIHTKENEIICKTLQDMRIYRTNFIISYHPTFLLQTLRGHYDFEIIVLRGRHMRELH